MPEGLRSEELAVGAFEALQIVKAESGAKSSALAIQSGPIDPDLASVIDAWPTLPEAIRAGILAMVRAAGR